MKLVKFVVAVGIAFLLASLLSTTLSTFYKVPVTNTFDCYELRDFGSEDTTAYDACIDKATFAIQNYQIIFLVILSVLGIGSMILGFSLLNKESVGVGIMGGGILTVMFGGLFGAISSVMSGFAALSGGSASRGVSVISYLNLAFLAISLGVLIFFAITKVERDAPKLTAPTSKAIIA